MNLLVFGDSITYGYYDSQGGWPERFYKAYKTGPNSSFQNFSLPGGTSKDVLRQLKRAINMGLLQQSNLKIFFAYGLNDAAPGFMDYISVKDFQDNTHAVINLVQKYEPWMAFVGLTIIDEDNRDGFGGLSFYSNKNIKLYNDALKHICGDYQLPFVDLYQASSGIREQYLMNLDDGIHPNGLGHDFILKEVCQCLGINS